MSREHYLPRCLGSFRNYDPLKDKICEECNSKKIGVLDEQFCRCGPEAFFRFYLDNGGKMVDRKPSAFYRGSASGKQIEMKTKHPTLNCDIYCEIIPGTKKTVPASQIIIEDRDGKFHSILISDNVKEVGDLKKELRSKGIGQIKFIECWTSESESEKNLMNKLCSAFGIKIDWSSTPPYQDRKNQPHITTVSVTDRHSRAIAKIGFHYLLKQFPHFTGFEDEFADIKKFIIMGGDQDRWVQQLKGSFVGQLQNGMTTEKYCHLLGIEKNQNEIRCFLQFFVGPTGVHHYYEVVLGSNPEKIIHPDRIGHQFVYFNEPDQEGYSGRMDPMHSIKHIMLT
jgi:hypothetical protein